MYMQTIHWLLLLLCIVYHTEVSVFSWGMVPHCLNCVEMLSNSLYYTTFRLVHHLAGWKSNKKSANCFGFTPTCSCSFKPMGKENPLRCYLKGEMDLKYNFILINRFKLNKIVYNYVKGSWEMLLSLIYGYISQNTSAPNTGSFKSNSPFTH